MIIWLNGAFGSGKTTTAFELRKRVPGSFVYDPENVGYFIRKNAPAGFSQGDFQDIPLWREMNYKMLKLITQAYDGVVIVPMTLVNPDYYNEIITQLTEAGIEVRHFILYACKETLLKRLRIRSVRMLGRESFAVKSIDRCIYAFDNYIKDIIVQTDNRSVDDIVAEIAMKSGIALSPDKRSKLRKIFDRYLTLIRHIR